MGDLRIQVRLFAGMRLSAGTAVITLELPEGATLGDALERLYERRPDLRAPGASALTAVGVDYATPDRVLRDGEEISLIPPVQGG